MDSFTILSEKQWYTLSGEKEKKYRRLIGEKRRGKILNTGFFVNDFDEIRLLGKFLNNNVSGFYHSDYHSGGAWEEKGTIENMIWTLKNDVDAFPARLPDSKQKLSNILNEDLPLILNHIGKSNLTVCVVPRSKSESHYRNDQLLFRETISDIVENLPNFQNGTNYIVRHTNTRTTHLNRTGEGGDGDLPYPGITKDTCTISAQVRGKDILLIDDLYTKTVNIDEDAIQALADKGANSVTFYSLGKTLEKNH